MAKLPKIAENKLPCTRHEVGVRSFSIWIFWHFRRFLAIHSYRSATSGSTLVARRAGM
jgi:hypothetical protein